ncbi:hypothetical protein FNH22_00340 [Fulvivirga sp. M361]|uniref:hypothetical protein n=1 Tax=Fulvivirga sp. M361 TaxID=2594266 RepID=UPI00117A3D7B|nr:hypothetical protein [Fulvivirga sp. M361]TRX62578.1 hypothetical protein FNH22_00340 [Fulvivirga sp. M361]
MEQRDLIKDEIERLGKALGKVLSDFLRLKSEGKVNEGIELADRQLVSEVDIDVAKMLTLTKEQLRTFLEYRKFTAHHLEDLSEYLAEIGHSTIENDPHTATLKLEKAVELLELADEITKTVSFDRMDKMARIERLLM